MRIIVSPRREDLAALNIYFYPLVFIGGAIIGSVLSAVIITGIVWAAIQLLRPSLHYTRDRNVHKIALCFVLFFVVELLSGFLHYAGKKTILALISDLPFLGLMPLYSAMFARRDDIRNVLEKGAIAASFLACVHAFIQFEYMGLRAQGMAGNSGVFGVMCLLLFAIDSLAVLRSHGNARWLAVLAALTAAAAVVFSGMRSLWPAILLLPPIIFFTYGRFLNFRLPKTALIVILVLLAAATCLLYEPARERVFAGVSDISQLHEHNYNSSLGERLIVWKAALGLISAQPLLGYGPGVVRDIMTAETWNIAGYPLVFNHFHNAVLTYWVRDGILGALALLLMLVAPLILSLQQLNDELSNYGFALLAALEFSYVTSGLFGIMFGHDIMDTVFVAGMALALFFIFHRDSATPSATDLISS